ncbi:IS3 family transposase [Marinilactibacillus psychrotolerans]|uniref:IS3 family transposase n=1 Tax=Marinilactibacillus psychrotolerans TaxID=191770 RepID=UPI0039AEE449
MSTRRPRRTYTEAFKKQIVDLHKAGKARKEIIEEYDLTGSAFDKWVRQHNQTGSFKEKDNLTPEQKELKELRKANTQLQMENDILKQAALIFGRKFEVIKRNKHKYSISAMCRALEISRGSYYYEVIKKESDAKLEQAIIEEFAKSKNNYGTRKLKKRMKQRAFTVSRRRIGRIMKKFHLVSKYDKPSYKPQKSGVNQAKIENTLNREFDQEQPMKAIVTDLTYVKVANKWFYVCFILDLFNREIIGYSAGPNKTADLVLQALATVKGDLHTVNVFHTDRGKEFDNHTIDELLDTFDIVRSLSRKGNPYDNAVAESTYKSFKFEFVYENTFHTLYELQVQLMDYVHWWNHFRPHGSLDYETPIDYREGWEQEQSERKLTCPSPIS